MGRKAIDTWSTGVSQFQMKLRGKLLFLNLCEEINQH